MSAAETVTDAASPCFIPAILHIIAVMAYDALLYILYPKKRPNVAILLAAVGRGR